MDVSPQLLREVEFREQWRGYNPDEVDSFLERLAVALEQLLERLKEANERATRAERRVLENDDDELRRTLVLAQRTADNTVRDATAEAERQRGEAEEQARTIVAAAEERATELEAGATSRSEEELRGISERRVALEADVQALDSYVAEQRQRLAADLRRQLDWLEAPGRLELPSRPDLTGEPLAEEPPVPPTIPDLADAEAEGQPEPEREPEVEIEVDAVDATAQMEQVDLTADEPEREQEIDIRGAERDRRQTMAAGSASGVDPFLAELRRAASDTEPLGPRDDDDVDFTAGDDALHPASRFRRRRRQ